MSDKSNRSFRDELENYSKDALMNMVERLYREVITASRCLNYGTPWDDKVDGDRLRAAVTRVNRRAKAKDHSLELLQNQIKEARTFLLKTFKDELLASTGNGTQRDLG